jgi:IPT/TIG domain
MKTMFFKNTTYWTLTLVSLVSSGCQVHIRTPPSTNLSQIPIILSIVPPNSLVLGGETITITGQNFNPQTTVTIDGHSCTSMDYISPTELQCQVPAHPSGSVSIVVAGPDQPVATGTFTYYAAMQGSPNFTVNLGGGITAKAASGKGITAVNSIGEPVQGLPQSATGISVHSGITGAITKP